MDSTLPDAFDASQPSLYAGQASSAGMVDPENTNGNMIASAPFVKVDDPPKFELESYIANYAG
jgi:COP9 signalosome complex subunit 1